MASRPATCVLDEPQVSSRASFINNLPAQDAERAVQLAVESAATRRRSDRGELQLERVSADGEAPPATRHRFFYGWLILPLAMLAMVASSPGQTFGVSIFNEPIRVSLGLSHTQMAAAYTLGTLLGAIPIMYIGMLMDRHGIRRTMLGVITAVLLSCLLISAAQNWLMLALGFFFLRMLGPGALSLLSGSALPFWFDRRLGMVEGLRSVGHAGSMAIVPMLNLWLVGEYGWRGAYALLGCGIWLVLFPLYLLLYRDRPEEVGQAIDNGDLSPSGSAAEAGAATVPLAQPPTPQHQFTLQQAFGTFSFWVAALGSSMFGLVHTALFFSMVAIYQERGLSEQDAANTMVVFAVSLAMMQLIGGVLADRSRPQPMLTIGLAGLSVGVAMLYIASDPLWAIASGLMMGATLGIYSGAVQPLWARYFGRQHLGKIRGVLMTMNIALSSVGPLIAGTVRDLQGDFDWALWVFIALPLPLAFLSCFAAAPRRPQAALEPVVLPSVEAPRAVLAAGAER